MSDWGYTTENGKCFVVFNISSHTAADLYVANDEIVSMRVSLVDIYSEIDV